MSPAGLARRSTASVRRAYQAARPFKHAVLDGFLTPSFAAALRADLATPRPEAFLEGKDLEGSFAICRDPRPLGPGLRRLSALLASAEFLAWLEDCTGARGLKLNDEPSCGGLFRFDQDAEMDVHLDSHDVDAHCAQKGHPRKVNLLLYLSAGWREEWGGRFEAYSDPSRPPARAYAPLFNRCILFDNHHASWHGVTRVDLPESARGRSRYVMISNYWSAVAAGTKPAPPRHNWWMPRPLPAHLRPGHRASLADALEVARLSRRREQRLAELRGLRASVAALDGGKPAPPPSPPKPSAPFAVLDALPERVRPGRVLSAADVAYERRRFAAMDAELRRLYKGQRRWIAALKARAPDLAPRGY